jgi:hypothetical protein
VRVVVALLFAVLAAFVAACGEGGETPSAAEDPITTVTRPEVVPTTPGLITGSPSGVTSTEIVVRGDVSGTVTDSAGNALGKLDAATGIQRVEIPGGTFLSGGDDDGGQYVLQNEGPYEGAWTADEDDEVVFVVHKRANFEAVQTAATLPFFMRAGDKLSLAFAVPADLGSLELAVDEGGDGSTNRTVPFGEPVVGAGASDFIQPFSRIEVEHVEGADGKPVRPRDDHGERQGRGRGRAHRVWAHSVQHVGRLHETDRAPHRRANHRSCDRPRREHRGAVPERFAGSVTQRRAAA